VIDVVEINRLRDLEPLRPAWHKLLAQTAGYSFFQTLEWLEASWDHYPERQRLRVLVVRRDDEPIGVVPWCVRTERGDLASYACSRSAQRLGTFYGRSVIRADKRGATLPRAADFIDLRWVDEAADEFLAIGEGFREASFDYRARPRMEVRMCRFAEGWDAYVQTRSRNWRRKMKHDIESLEKAGAVRHLRYRPAQGDGTDADHLAIYDVCEQLAAKTWQAEDQSQSTLSSPRVRDMLRKTHVIAARLGMLDANLLYIGDQSVAFNYNYFAEGRSYGLRCGTTVGLEAAAVSLYKMLEDGFRRGDVSTTSARRNRTEPSALGFGTRTRFATTPASRCGLVLSEEVDAALFPQIFPSET
jgi:CelD/BcsL family acetyltransferase involved in cellulose biosynthesis